MSRVIIFADEAGNFDFSRKRDASQYFILTTVTAPDWRVGEGLLALRRQLAWEGEELRTDFHAAEERQAIRDRVFGVLGQHDFVVDATIIEKAKTAPDLHRDEALFYQTAWYLHLNHVVRHIVDPADELLLAASSIGTRKKQHVFHRAVRDAVCQTVPKAPFRTVFWQNSTDPCLWVADYCCWAIQRKWERGDCRSYDLIKTKVRTESDAFAINRERYY